MNRPKISIITPSYNQGPFIEQTIRSVIEQGYPNIEYIVMDGGSSDETVDILRNYDQQITYWESKPDRGQTHAINKGFQMASGDIITWLNSDDYYEAGTFHNVVEYFKQPGVQFLAGSVNLVDKQGDFLETKQSKWPAIGDAFETEFVYMPQPATFFRKSLLNKVGFLDENFHYSMDFDFWLRLRMNKIEFTIVSDVFTNFRMHENAKTHSGQNKFVSEVVNKYANWKYLKNRDMRRMLKHHLSGVVNQKQNFPQFDTFKINLINKIVKNTS